MLSFNGFFFQKWSHVNLRSATFSAILKGKPRRVPSIVSDWKWSEKNRILKVSFWDIYLRFFQFLIFRISGKIVLNIYHSFIAYLLVNVKFVAEWITPQCNIGSTRVGDGTKAQIEYSVCRYGESNVVSQFSFDFLIYLF